MRFELKVAVRYLTSARLQTALLVVGVTIGIMVFTFVAALIGGLRTRLTTDVVGNLPHVTLEPPDELPRLLPPERPGTLAAAQPPLERRPIIRDWRALLAVVRATPGIAVASPEVIGGGLALRGQRSASVAINGVEPDKVSAIVDVEGGLVSGTLRLGPADVILGETLAEDLQLEVGRRVVVRGDSGRERTLVVRGVFDVGAESVNERVVFVDLDTARTLLDIESGVSRIAIKLVDLYAAPRAAARLGRATGLEAKHWVEQNERLEQALRAQAQTGRLIKIFSMLTIVIGVASTLLLAATRRRSEIGIMLGMGVSRRSLAAIFLTQGLIVGIVGSLSGAAFGWLFTTILRAAPQRPDGTPLLPVDPAQGSYLAAIALATLAGGVAAILPARAAARVDPVEVIES